MNPKTLLILLSTILLTLVLNGYTIINSIDTILNVDHFNEKNLWFMQHQVNHIKEFLLMLGTLAVMISVSIFMPFKK